MISSIHENILKLDTLYDGEYPYDFEDIIDEDLDELIRSPIDDVVFELTSNAIDIDSFLTAMEITANPNITLLHDERNSVKKPVDEHDKNGVDEKFLLAYELISLATEELIKKENMLIREREFEIKLEKEMQLEKEMISLLANRDTSRLNSNSISRNAIRYFTPLLGNIFFVFSALISICSFFLFILVYIYFN